MRRTALPRPQEFANQQTQSSGENLRRQLISRGIPRADAPSLDGRAPDGSRFLDGKLFKDISFIGGAVTVINHGMGNAPRGWSMKRVRGAANTGFEVERTATQLMIQASTTFVADVWVF
tara:strand:+ start:1493 stop:1849 length:357 start_codon:yes stop_codon:yes gene_type:complete